MDDVIVNKVAQSGLVIINLDDFYTEGKRFSFDLKDFLFEETILREKDFREMMQQHNWEQYRNGFVAVYCSADAIVPTWAYMLVAARLSDIAAKIFFGNAGVMESFLYDEKLKMLDPEIFKDQRVVIKGCSKKFVPPSAFVTITHLLVPQVRSLMFGEACSTVPVYKKGKG